MVVVHVLQMLVRQGDVLRHLIYLLDDEIVVEEVWKKISNGLEVEVEVLVELEQIIDFVVAEIQVLQVVYEDNIVLVDLMHTMEVEVEVHMNLIQKLDLVA